MKEVFRYIFFVAPFCLLVACADTSNSVQDIVTYVESDGSLYRRNIVVGEFEYEFLYKPVPYVVYKEMQGDVSDTATYNSRCNDLRGTVWFNVSVKVNGSNENPLKYNVNDLNEYNDRLSYFLNQAGQNFQMKYGDNDAEMIAYHFENNYGLTPMDVMILGYKIPDEKPLKDIVLIYTDDLFNNGPVRIKLTKEELKKIQ